MSLGESVHLLFPDPGTQCPFWNEKQRFPLPCRFIIDLYLRGDFDEIGGAGRRKSQQSERKG